jgi:hypothetical protein
MTWLPIWAGWVFIVAALPIVVPSARIALGNKSGVKLSRI